jgi:mannitol/fructose-specific phosphotransferase system IIA component (Ntr-type)
MLDAEVILPDAHVLLDVTAPSVEALLRRMVGTVLGAGQWHPPDGIDADRLLRLLLERHAEQPSGLGQGIAFPHARLPGVDHAALCVARLSEPLDFGAPDGEAVHLVVLLLLPEARPHFALKCMGALAGMVSDPGLARALREAREPARVVALLESCLRAIASPVRAGDIMRAPVVDIFPDTPLRDVVRLMLDHQLEAVAVLSREHAVLGEITADRLFQIGMPPFFTQLKSVGFIREFDPFERYFPHERMSCACDVMDSHFATLPEDATLLEVVFALAVRRHPKIYVVRAGRRIGVIDRMQVLDRVLNS